MRYVSLLLVWITTVDSSVFAQFTYQNEVNLFAGTVEGEYGNGISLYDINKDGFDDITICTKDAGVLVYLNDNLNFSEYAVIPFVGGDLKHPVWVDYDNDDDPDFCVSSANGVHLFRNDLGVFTNITDSLHLPDNSSTSYGMAWIDYNLDGWLDVYIANYEYFFPDSNTNWLLRNNGQGGFENVTEQCQCGNDQRASFQPVWLDVDGDHLPELFVINDKFHGNTFFKNEGSVFSDQSVASGFYREMEAMSNSWTDIDHDLLPDVYISNTTDGNALLRMTESGFVDTAPENGIEINSVCWNAMWIDYDHNGWEDLHVATNSFSVNGNLNPLFRHVNNEFIPIAIQGDNKSVLCSAKGDLNGDGYWDYVEVTQYPISLRIFLNDGGENHWLKVGLKGNVSCHDGIGAQIHYYIEGEHKVRYTFCGEGFLSQDSQTEILSLGDADQIDLLVVDWPSGWHDTYFNISANQFLSLEEGESFWYETATTHHVQMCDGDTSWIALNSVDEILWFDGVEDPMRLFVDDGVYPYQIMNENGFSFVDSIVVELLPLPQLETTAYPVSCHGGNDGNIIFENLDTSWLIQWTPPIENQKALSAGVYFISATDTLQCVTTLNLEVTEPDSIILNFETSDVCVDEWSTVIWDINGGFPPYTLSNGDELPDSLPAGNHQLFVMDEHACISEVDILIETLPSPAAEIAMVNDINGDYLIANVVGGVEPFTYQWSDGGTEDTLGLSHIGLFSVLVVDANGCVDEDEIDVITNLDERNLLLDVFPNPCSDELMIETSYYGKVFVFDAIGQMITTLHTYPGTNSFDVSSWSCGEYFLHGNNGSRKVSKR
ncbi:MAG: VCBS repeat-containing protein [Flavobacteriales bacterium]|nr:VCBS repeat-containing protein [Flavobacteriales bacterium]